MASCFALPRPHSVPPRNKLPRVTTRGPFTDVHRRRAMHVLLPTEWSWGVSVPCAGCISFRLIFTMPSSLVFYVARVRRSNHLGCSETGVGAFLRRRSRLDPTWGALLAFLPWPCSEISRLLCGLLLYPTRRTVQRKAGLG